MRIWSGWNAESDDDENSDLTEFITELMNQLEKDSKLLDKYVKRAKKTQLAWRDAENHDDVVKSESWTRVNGERLQQNRVKVSSRESREWERKELSWQAPAASCVYSSNQ